MSRIYLSGKISGLPLEVATRAFAQEKARLEVQGWEVVSPMDNGIPQDAAYEKHLAEDILLLLGCKAIYMMRGWEDSLGARIEHALAQRIKMAVIYAQDLRDE